MDIERGWNGALTFPRKMTLKDGVPYTEPDERVEELRDDELAYKNKHHFSGTRLTGIQSRTFEIVSKFNLRRAESMTTTVLANEDGTIGIPITFDGFKLSVGDEFIPLFDNRTKRINIRVLVDRSVVIVFANGKSLTKTVTPPVDGSGYADNVVLSTVGSKSLWYKFHAYSLGSVRNPCKKLSNPVLRHHADKLIPWRRCHAAASAACFCLPPGSGLTSGATKAKVEDAAAWAREAERRPAVTRVAAPVVWMANY